MFFFHQKLYTLHFTGIKAKQNVSYFPSFEISVKKQQQQQQPPGGLIFAKTQNLANDDRMVTFSRRISN